jgi:hypothetical protein
MASTRGRFRELYDRLGVATDASDDDIRRAYVSSSLSATTLSGLERFQWPSMLHPTDATTIRPLDIEGKHCDGTRMSKFLFSTLFLHKVSFNLFPSQLSETRIQRTWKKQILNSDKLRKLMRSCLMVSRIVLPRLRGVKLKGICVQRGSPNVL